MRVKDPLWSLSLQKLTKFLGLSLCLLPVLPAIAGIVTVKGSGEYSFGPNTSEVEACDQARQLLISNTARAHFGERIEFDETQICSSKRAKKGAVACDLDQRMFFSLDENLSVIDVTLTETMVSYPQSTKRYSCKAAGAVRFEYIAPSVDQSWTTSLEVNRRLLDENRLVFDSQSSKAGFHYIFEDRGASGFSLLYPNELDAPRRIIGGFSVPSGSAKRSYRMTVDKANHGGSGRLFRALMLSSKTELAIDQLTPGVISRERMARLKEQLEPGSWTQKKLSF